MTGRMAFPLRTASRRAGAAVLPGCRLTGRAAAQNRRVTQKGAATATSGVRGAGAGAVSTVRRAPRSSFAAGPSRRDYHASSKEDPEEAASSAIPGAENSHGGDDGDGRSRHNVLWYSRDRNAQEDELFTRNLTLGDGGALIAPNAAQHQKSIVFLHGLGDSSEGFAPFFAQYLFAPENDVLGSFRHVRVRLPNAPLQAVTLNQGAVMRSWYDVVELGGGARHSGDGGDGDDSLLDAEGLDTSRRFVADILREEAELVGGSHNVVLGGFSQGAVLAAYLGLQHDQPLGGIISMSGYVWPTLDAAMIHDANRYTPWLAFHGGLDDVIARDMAISSYERIRDLAELHDTMTIVEDPHCGHGLSEMSIGSLSAFLKVRLELPHDLDKPVPDGDEEKA